jgi:hypothetical protein
MAKLKNSLHFFLIFFLFSILISRFLIYFPVPDFLSEFLNDFVPFQNFFLYIFNFRNFFPIFLVILPIILTVLLIKFPKTIFIKEKNIKLRFLPNLIIILLLILGNLFIDINPFLTIISLLSIPLFLLAKKSKRFVLFSLFLFLPFSHDLMDFFAVVLWIFILYFPFKKIKRFSNKDLVVILFVLSLIPQAFSSLIPIFFNFHKGIKLGEGMAYFFCQSPKNRHIFASISHCPTFQPGNEKEFENCKNGKIIEYGENLEKITDHNFFTSNFYGRVEGLICLPESLIIGVTNLKTKNFFYNSMGLEYFPDKKGEPTILKIKDRLGGNGAIYDPINNALFTFSEDAKHVYRWDLKTGKWDFEIAKYWDVGPLIVGVDGIYFKRKSLFAGEFLGGEKTIEFSSKNFEILNYYSSPDGAITGITVDNKLDRVIISGFWGFSVIDLISKKVLKKIRTGFLPRAAVIDEKNNLVFIASTLDGKIRVFNRESYTLIKTIPVGFGVRNLLVEKLGKNLLFGNNKDHYFLPINSL